MRCASALCVLVSAFFAPAAAAQSSPELNEKERALAAALSIEIERLYPPFVDAETERYLTSITARLQLPAPLFVQVIQSHAPTVCSIPGRVYLSDSLILRLDSEAALAAVIAQHAALQAIQRTRRDSEPSPGPVIFLGGGCADGLVPDALANSANRLGIEILARSGYSAEAYIDALRLRKTPASQIEQAVAALDQIRPRNRNDLVTSSGFAQLQDRLRVRRAQQFRLPRRPTLYR